MAFPSGIDPAVGSYHGAIALVSGGSGPEAQDHLLAHAHISATVAALQTKVGVNGSSDPNSLDYKVSHLTGGGDMLKSIFATINPSAGVVDKSEALSTSGATHQFWKNGNLWARPDYTDLTGVPLTFTPRIHGPSHAGDGSDPIPLDSLGQPSDNINLNACATAHGLLPKLANSGTKYLKDDGTWDTPAGGGGGGIYILDDAVSPAAGDEVSLIFSSDLFLSLTDAVSDAVLPEVSMISAP